MTALVLFLIDCAAKSCVLLLLAWFATLALRRSPAATRHLVWLTALVAILVLPLAQAIVPGRAVVSIKGIGSAVPAPAPTQTIKPLRVAQDLGPALAQIRDSSALDFTEDARALSVAKGKVATPAPRSEPLWPTALGLWAFVAGLVCIHCLCGIALARRNRATATSNDLDSLASAAGIHRPVRVRLARKAQPGFAMTYGVLRPVILLPKAAKVWPPERLRSVLLHELAHIRRLDWLWQNLANLACALHWFNPLAWFGAKCLRAEAETAADDFVLSLGCAPSAYARDLLEVAAELGPQRRFEPISGVTAMRSPRIQARIQSILEPGRSHRGATGVELLAAAVLGTAVLLPLSGMRSAIAGPMSPALALASTPPASPSVEKPHWKVVDHGNRVEVEWTGKTPPSSISDVVLTRHSQRLQFISITPNGKGHYVIDEKQVADPSYVKELARSGVHLGFLDIKNHSILMDSAAHRRLRAHVARERLSEKVRALAQVDRAEQDQQIRSAVQAELAARKIEQRVLEQQRKAMLDQRLAENGQRAAVADALEKAAKAQYVVSAEKKAEADSLYRQGVVGKLDALSAEAEAKKALADLTIAQQRLPGHDPRAEEEARKALTDTIAQQDLLKANAKSGEDRLGVVEAEMEARKAASDLIVQRGQIPSPYERGLAEQKARKALADTLAVKSRIDALFSVRNENVKKAQDDYDQARREYDKARALYRQGAIDKAQFELANKDQTIALLNLRIAQLEAGRGR